MYLRHIASYIHVYRRAKSVGKGFYCGGRVYVTKNTVIKNHVSMGILRVLAHGNFTVGNYTKIGENLLVITGNHNYMGELLPFDLTWTYKDVVIDDYCWIGANVILLPGTHIGEGAIIQAGSVVHGEIPPMSIAGGNPAKVFKYRDKEHFLKLKEKEAGLTI